MKLHAPVTLWVAGLLVLASLTLYGSDLLLIRKATAAGVGEQPFYVQTFSRRPTVPAMTALGRKLFTEPALSATGKVSCASCHDPVQAYGPPDAQPVRYAGADGRQAGLRAVPSLRYLQNVPRFTEHFYEADGDDSEDQGPAGGRTWDGRAQSAHEQAELPLLSPLEMANTSRAGVIARLRTRPIAKDFRDTFGDDVLTSESRAWSALLLALEVFQQSPADFSPYDSKYDAYLRHQTQLSAAESRGLKVFEDENKGNCMSCHQSRIRDGAFPGFTDFGLVSLGVPRNGAIPANNRPGHYDLGLCGPLRTDLAQHPEYCGLFRTPTLRNVGRRQVFFHNGVYHSLRDVLRFYARRDVQPQAFYPRDIQGHTQRFDDLPRAYWKNVNSDPPFGGKPGAKPAFSEADMDDLIAFLGTLSDGYRPPQPRTDVTR